MQWYGLRNRFTEKTALRDSVIQKPDVMRESTLHEANG